MKQTNTFLVILMTVLIISTGCSNFTASEKGLVSYSLNENEVPEGFIIGNVPEDIVSKSMFPENPGYVTLNEYQESTFENMYLSYYTFPADSTELNLDVNMILLTFEIKPESLEEYLDIVKNSEFSGQEITLRDGLVFVNIKISEKNIPEDWAKNIVSKLLKKNKGLDIIKGSEYIDSDIYSETKDEYTDVDEYADVSYSDITLLNVYTYQDEQIVSDCLDKNPDSSFDCYISVDTFGACLYSGDKDKCMEIYCTSYDSQKQKDICNLNRKQCDLISNESLKAECNADRYTANYCTKLVYPDRSTCFYVVARDTNNPNFCGQIFKDNSKDACYYNMAVRMKDESLCYKISLNHVGQFSRSACFDYVQQTSN